MKGRGDDACYFHDNRQTPEIMGTDGYSLNSRERMRPRLSGKMVFPGQVTCDHSGGKGQDMHYNGVKRYNNDLW